MAIPLSTWLVFALGIFLFEGQLEVAWERFLHTDSREFLKIMIFKLFFILGFVLLSNMLPIAEPTLTLFQGLGFAILALLLGIALRLFPKKVS